MTERKTVSLKLVPISLITNTVNAPPVLEASSHTVDYACGGCKTVLMHADDNQVHNLIIRCVVCGLYNSTDA